MKKFKTLAAIAAGFAAIFLAGCSNITSATVEGVTEKSTAPLTINVTTDSDLIDFSTSSVNGNAASRSILPDAYTADGVKFYLCYKKTTDSGYTAAPLSVNFIGVEEDDGAGGKTTSKKEGTVTINLSRASYDLELFAVKDTTAATASNVNSESSLLNNACLRATAQADLRYAQPVSFFMTSEGLKKQGTVTLKLFAQGWDPDEYVGYDVKAALYYTKSTNVSGTTYPAGKLVTSTDKNLVDCSTDQTIKISSSIPKDTAPTTANYTLTGVNPGTYLFEVTFQKHGEETKFYWNDDIKILPDADTAVSVGITPVIDEEPVAPKDFAAGYVDNITSEYYDVEFTWDGSEINNESNFKIDLLTVTSDVGDEDAVNPTTDAEWEALLGKATPAGGAAENTQYENDFVGSLVYSAGSLGKNSETATFRLAYGKRYVARLCAVNDIGDSDWTYCDISTGITGVTADGTVDATGFNSSTINRYKVTYNTSGGSLKDKNNGAGSVAIAKVYACSQMFITGDDTSDTYPAGQDEDNCWFTVAGGVKTYHTYTGGVEIMSPTGKVDFTHDVLGTDEVIEKPVLFMNSKQTWTNWNGDVDANNANVLNEIGSRPAPYGGFANLILVANFATQATVTLFDDKDYTIASVTPETTFTGDDSESHYYVTWSQETVDTEKWVIKAPANVIYDYVTVTLIKTSNKDDTVPVSVKYDSAKKEYTATFNVSEYKTGIYDTVIKAYSPVRPDDPYTAHVSVTITD